MDLDESGRVYSDSPALLELNNDNNDSDYFHEKEEDDCGDSKSTKEGNRRRSNSNDEKRILRPPKFDKKHINHDHNDDSDGEIEYDSDDFHQSCLDNSLSALKLYFYNRLEQTILFLGGTIDLLNGWKVQILKRNNGLTLGLLEIFYFSNRGKKFRSRVEVACYLNLMPIIKSLRTMTKDQYYLNAIENREKHLISQQLALSNNYCDEINFNNDVITLINNHTEDHTIDTTTMIDNNIQNNDIISTPKQKENKIKKNSPGQDANSASIINFNQAKNLYFSFGNMVVLDWGRIIQDPAFHTNSQLYPLGFKCLRQEHDVTLDRVVDCLCEIDAVYEGGDGLSLLQLLKNNLPIDTNRVIQPLFRLSVAWHIGDELSIGTATEQDHISVRVYEARSSQQAWQAAMLEGLGIKDESLLSVRPHLNPASTEHPGTNTTSVSEKSTSNIPQESEDDADNVTDHASGEEEQDEEELQLRQKIREQRRAYFRVLRAEQSAGMQAAVRPRLSLDTVDSFAEELILRLFEGMEGSINCRNYMYMDSREREGGKKNMQKCYTKAYTKAKNLDRVIRKNVYLSEQIHQLEQKRKRMEDLESRKRSKIEDKETKTLIVAAQKSRNLKIKELEKNITALKVSLSKMVKKRRDDAKLLAEVLCDREEIQRFSRTLGLSPEHPTATTTSTANSSSNNNAQDRMAGATTADIDETLHMGPRPEPIQSAVVLEGHVVGRLLEVWEFLHTFHREIVGNADQVPSIDSLIAAVKVFDPAYKSIRAYTKSLDHSYDKVSQFQVSEPYESDASHLLNRLGMTMTSVLLKDFERIMGIDIAELQLGSLRIPVNTLTWREILRIVLLNTCCREVGVSEADVAALIKGRGFFTTPESADRKVLKLARRRIKFAYLIRSELQESVYGFTSGLCVHLPAPAVPYYEGTVVWSDLIASLVQVPDQCGWLIYELIKAAALSVCIIDTTPAAKKLKRSLQSAIGLPSFRMDNGGEAKAAALQILAEEEEISLKWKQSNGRWKSSIASNSSAPSSLEELEVPVGTTIASLHHDDAAQSIREKLELVYNQTPYMIPTSTFDVWEKQIREALRHANLGVSTDDNAENLDEPDSERDLTSAMDEDTGEDGGVEVQSESVKDENKEDEQTNAVTQSIDDDTKQAEKLSIAMQRCYLAIRDLMLHPQAQAFNWPVDHTVLPAYYKSVAQPLSFSDVRKYLVEGQYADSIYDFYTDVLMVIENAMAYNPENSTVKVSAQKLSIVFERLFFETVLCWDNALPFQDCCHACRSAHPITDEKSAVCDRCEGCYHLHCLDPPLQIPPRSEWYCLSCVEQKGIPSAHPYKTADVVHPMDPQSRGEVVGIEQIRQTVMFVVEFGSVREMWDGKKVRKYALEPVIEELIAPKGSFALHDDADVNKGVLGFLSNTTPAVSSTVDTVADSDAIHSAGFQPIVTESVYHMPSGYSYEDYDRVCGIARAYTGWGASHYLVPPVLMDQHNLAAQARSKHDAMFPQYRECIAALGFAAGGVLGDTMSAVEWSTVLNSLLHRILDGSAVSDRLTQLDDAVDDDLIAQIQDGVHSNSLPLEKIYGFVRGEGLVKQVKPVEVEPSSDAPRRGRKRRVDILAAAAKLAAAAAGEDEDAGDEDGEDEWDEDMDEVVPTKEVKKEKAAKVSKKGKRMSADDDEEEMVFDEPTKPNSKTSRKQGSEETDSADEDDDLEFYDADGNCLTSAVVDISTIVNNTMSPPARLPSSSNTQSEYGVGCDLDVSSSGVLESPTASAEEKPAGPETEEDWNLRLLSRQKGREDALLTHILVYDMLTQLDLDGTKEKDDEVFKLVQLEDIGGDFFTHATNAIVKSCLGRPSESLVAPEWTRGWETKMAYMQNYLQEYSLQEREIVCPICGFEEGYLGSPLVWGQTSEEWEADVAADIAQDVLTEPEPPSETNAFPLAAGVSASTGIKGFRARYRVMKGLCWMPYDEADAQIEEAECVAPKRGLKKGSLVMHECCANFVHFNRQIKHDKSRKMEDQRIVEVISGIGRAKCTPIGTDRDGSFYWIFHGSKALYVSYSEYNTLRENAAVKRPLGTSRWSVYTTDADIHDVLVWLDPKISTERILKKILSLLFPRALADETAEESKPVAADAELNSTSMLSIKAEESAEEQVIDAAAGSSEDNLMEISPEATPTAPGPVAPIPRALPRPVGSLLLSGDIMEQSGDEGNSGDEAEHASSSGRKLPTEEMDCDEDSGEVDALKDAEKPSLAPSSADSTMSSQQLSLLKLRKEHATEMIRQRPSITQRSELLQVFAPVDTPLPVVNKSSNLRCAAFKYRKGEHVLVDSSARNHILWDAHVLETKATRISDLDVSDNEVVQINLYKLRFARWGSAYDGWYEECQLLPSGATVSAVGHAQATTRAIAQESKINFIRRNVWTAPEILQSLQAYQYLKEPMRACGTAPPLNYSDCQSAVGQLRAAMLLIEAALPIGAVDESDDRWGDDFVTAWREAVAVASDAISLMQCQLMLEYGIRTSWLKPAGLKMFSCLPSRAHCLRNATLGMVAIRVWVLDLTVKYDQVKKEEKASSSSGKGRPPKHPTGGAGRLVGTTGKKGK